MNPAIKHHPVFRKAFIMSTSIDIETFQTMFKVLEERLRDSENEIRNLKRSHEHCPSCGTRSHVYSKPKEKQFYDLSLPEAVMSILWETNDPINIRTLKQRLLESGYPVNLLGRYGNRLHTVVWRLSDGERPRIKRLEGDEIIAIR